MQALINQAVEYLNQGKLVAFATETVYGLGANASDPAAVARIFQVKGRPLGHPLIVHLAEMGQLSRWAREISPQVLRLAYAFWPGPLTLILKKSSLVLPGVTGGQDTVGIRVPGHPIAQALLRAFGGGIAAPSANRFGRISPTTADAVKEELGDAVELILDGDQCLIGLESTIVDMTAERPVILRPGGISARQIREILQMDLAAPHYNSPRVSGTLQSHYAPLTHTRIVQSAQVFLQNLTEKDLPCALLVNSPLRLPDLPIEGKQMPTNPQQYAHELYETLRYFDKKGHRQIVVEAVPEGEEWDAVRDRLSRASFMV